MGDENLPEMPPGEAPPEGFKGEWKSIEDILGKRIVLEKVVFKDSRDLGKESIAIVQARIFNTQDFFWFRTASEILVARLKNGQKYLPVQTTIVKPPGRKYYTFA